jgi:cysteine desulfurase / selenocysteine lyase
MCHCQRPSLSYWRKSMAVDWAGVRSEFPALQDRTFLNTATFGQLARRTSDAVARHFARRDELACADFLEWFDDADRIRESIARLIHSEADDVAFVQNASSALAILFSGIDWRAGDRVVILENEFPNHIYAASAPREPAIEFMETQWERFYESINERTRVVLMSTVNYTNGFRPPLAEISRYLRERGVLFYLDGTQSVGALELDCAEIKPDMLAVHGYKWLLSPNGSAFLYVNPEVRKWLRPNVIGWRSDRDWRRVDSLNHGAPVFVDKAEKYEGGMLIFPMVYAMGASVGMMLEIGPREIEQRVLALSALACEALRGCGGTIVHEGSPIIAARFEGRDASLLARALKEQRIQVSARHGNLRVSVHFYNNEGDISRLVTALGNLL